MLISLENIWKHDMRLCRSRVLILPSSVCLHAQLVNDRHHC